MEVASDAGAMLLFSALFLGFTSLLSIHSQLASGVLISPDFPEPLDNPEALRHHVAPPSKELFPRGFTRFSGYRGGCDRAAFANYSASGLGDVFWPQYVRRCAFFAVICVHIHGQTYMCNFQKK